jgi:hypothetical protein
MRALKVLVVSLILGALLCLVASYFWGKLAATMIDHQYFGAPVQVGIVTQDLLAWVPLCLVAGAVASAAFEPRVLVGVIAVSAAAMLMLVTGVWHGLGFGVAELQSILYLFKLPLFIILVFVPLGAFFVARRKRVA